VALAALETAAHHFPVRETAVRKGLQEVCWPGRMEAVLQRPQVILDGAHNPEGIATLVKETQARVGTGKVKLLFAAMQDKEWDVMLRSLCAIAHEIVLTKVATQRSAEPEKLATAVPEGIRWSIVADPFRALRLILRQADPGDVILVTGSLYLVGQVRPYFFAGEDVLERQSFNVSV
jgi:dihydrofolate synthase/folylpolyglutamate synthase